MATNTDVYVRLKLQSQEFDQGMTRATKKLNDFDGELESSKNKMSAWTGAITALGVGVAGATLAIVKITNAMAENVFEAEKYSERLGIATKELLNLQSAGRDFGVEAEDISEGLKNMTERLGEAILEGKGATFDALTKLGLDLEYIESLSTDQRLYSIAGALSEVESEAERTFLTMEIFQEEGFKMAEMLALGEDGLKNYVNEQNKFTDSIDIEQLKEYRTQLNSLSKTFESGSQIIAMKFVGALSAVNKQIDITIQKLFGVYKEDLIPDDTLKNIKKAEEGLKRIREQDAQDKLWQDQLKAQEERILAENKANEKTIAQQEEINRLYRWRKETAEELERKDGLFFNIMENITKEVIESTNDIVQKEIQSDLPSLTPRFQGLLERGSAEEASVRGGEVNEIQRQQAEYLKQLVELQKKRERQFKINLVG